MSFDLIPGLSIAASGMDAERARMNVAANNIANANSTDDGTGKVYRRHELVFASVLKDNMDAGETPGSLGGVEVGQMTTDNAPPMRVFAPYHPKAGPDGMVDMPNIQPIKEMVDMISATRSYETNLVAIKTAREMADGALRLGK